MDWTKTFDIYCERLDASFWAEPVNAITNAAFLVAAILMWGRSKGDFWARVLSAMLFAIGIGSFLFHTFATGWALAADVVPILLFSLTYIYVANRYFWGWRIHWAVLGTLAYFPYSYLVSNIARSQFPALGGTADYAPLPILIAIYGLLLLKFEPRTGHGLLIGAGILLVSMIFRTLDLPLCQDIPLGTHYFWHVLNGIMLGWMIETYLRHISRQAA